MAGQSASLLAAVAATLLAAGGVRGGGAGLHGELTPPTPTGALMSPPSDYHNLDIIPTESGSSSTRCTAGVNHESAEETTPLEGDPETPFTTPEEPTVPTEPLEPSETTEPPEPAAEPTEPSEQTDDAHYAETNPGERSAEQDITTTSTTPETTRPYNAPPSPSLRAFYVDDA